MWGTRSKNKKYKSNIKSDENIFMSVIQDR